MRHRLLLILCLLLSPAFARADLPGFTDWAQVEAQARGQTVYWRAWAGDAQVNRFIAWAAQQMQARYGIELRHVKEEDQGNVITAILADKAAGRDSGGRTDLVWINGANFAALKQRHLLYGPFAQSCRISAWSIPLPSRPLSAISPSRQKGTNCHGAWRC